MGWAEGRTSVDRGGDVAVGEGMGVGDRLGNAVGRRSVSLGSAVWVDLGVGVSVSHSTR